MRNQLWLCGLFARRNPAMLVIAAAGLLSLAAIGTSRAAETDTLKWLLFWALSAGNAINALPAALASRQFARLLPDAAAQARRWTLGGTAISIAVFYAIYVLTLGALLPWWAALALIAGCHLATLNRRLYIVSLVPVLAIGAIPAAFVALPPGLRWRVSPWRRPVSLRACRSTGRGRTLARGRSPAAGADGCGPG